MYYLSPMAPNYHMPFSINFNLKDKKSKGETLIYVKFTENGKTFKRSTKLKVHPKEWSLKRHEAKSDTAYAFNINKKLERIKTAIIETYNSFVSDGNNPSFKDYETAINNVDNEDALKKESRQFFECFDLYIKRKRVKEKTIIKNRSIFNNLIQFQEWLKQAIHFEDFDEDFFHEFVDYCIDVRENVNSTIERQVSLIKSFLTWALRKGYHNNIKYQEFKFSYNTESTIITLTNEERQKLFDFDFSYSKRLDRVKDAFMLACYSGLRYSDLAQLKEANIEDNKIVFTSYKTTKKQVIPFNFYVKTIINKYFMLNDFLHVISNQKFNDYIKEICKIAEINKPTQKIQFRRGERKETVLPKYEFITTHTARRTFGTLYLRDGGKLQILQRIFGHSRITTTMKYLGINEKDIEEDMRRVFPDDERNLKFRSKEKVNIAKNLLENNVDPQIIALSTGLTLKEIKTLKK